MKKFFKSVLKYIGKFLSWFFFNNWVWVPVLNCLAVWFCCVDPLIGQPFNHEVWRSFFAEKDMNYQILQASDFLGSSLVFAFSMWYAYFLQWVVDKISSWFERRKEKDASRFEK